MYEIIIKLSFIILAILITGVLLVKRYVYFRPSREFLPFKQDSLKNNIEELYEGDLHGWFLRGKNSQVILFCHGNAGNISHRQEIILSLHQLGYSVLIFDYSGYGKSSGIPSEKQLYHDANRFMQILLINYKVKDIIPYGESMGAPVALHIALKYQTPKVIIDSGLPSIRKIIQHKYSFISFLSFIFSEFNTEEYLFAYKGKLLVMHSMQDEIIPYATIQNIKSRADQFINIEGTHNNRIIPWDKVNYFLNGGQK
jgi:pimeloyl-ACP methyl ester carboxylesterase